MKLTPRWKLRLADFIYTIRFIKARREMKEFEKEFGVEVKKVTKKYLKKKV